MRNVVMKREYRGVDMQVLVGELIVWFGYVLMWVRESVEVQSYFVWTQINLSPGWKVDDLIVTICLCVQFLSFHFLSKNVTLGTPNSYPPLEEFEVIWQSSFVMFGYYRIPVVIYWHLQCIESRIVYKRSSNSHLMSKRTVLKPGRYL